MVSENGRQAELSPGNGRGKKDDQEQAEKGIGPKHKQYSLIYKMGRITILFTLNAETPGARIGNTVS